MTTRVLISDSQGMRTYQVLDGALPVGTDREITPDAAEAVLIVLRQRLRTGIGTNRDYLALSTPTAAQTTAQVAALSRQVTALSRVLLGLLDDSGGT
jgi:hypothetical protein